MADAPEVLVRRFYAALEAGDHDTVRGCMSEQVVVTGTYRRRREHTGRTLEAEFCHVWWVAGGRVTEFPQFNDTAAFADAMP